MIKVEARKTKFHIPDHSGRSIPPPAFPVPDGTEERYLDPDKDVDIAPSDYEEWGSIIYFPNGNNWVVRQEPEELVKRIENHRSSKD